MPAAYLSLGSNIDPEHHLPRAVAALARLGPVRATSKVYESEAVGPAGQPRFLNAAVRLDVEMSESELRRRLREIESDLGRVRTEVKFAPRTIDLDLIALRAFVDPDVSRRAYLAVTLAEIAPELPIGTEGETASIAADRLRRTAELLPRPDLDLAIAAPKGRNG
jgi:2-amino-4-hydroxy-6-hydroxymethyldihydropteridine diphosphokinase